MDIQYTNGDVTRPHGEGPRIIVHVCNDNGGWGRGFVLAVSQRWREPEQQYRAWFHAGASAAPPFALGQVQFVLVEEQLWVANLIGQHRVRRAGGPPPIRYEAVRAGLARVAQFAQQQHATVHMPRIGTGLAGGQWDVISRIIDEEVLARGVPVTVYDLDQPGT